MITIAIIGILAAVAVPNFISYRNKAYCTEAENDAVNILLTLTDYFSIPAHDGVITGNILNTGGVVAGVEFAPLTNNNVATLTAVGFEHTVVVTDVSGRCPVEYRVANTGNGWSAIANTFTKTL